MNSSTDGSFDVAGVMARLPAERTGRPAPPDVIAKRGLFALPQADTSDTPHDRTINGVHCRIVEGTSGVVVVYLHGGGYWGGDAESYCAYAQRLATTSGATIVVPNYRLAPEHPYPAGVRDAFAVYLGLRCEDSGRPVVVAGDSAGGGLAASISVASHVCGVPRPDGQALMSPWLDLRCDAASYSTATDPNFARTAALRARELYLCGEDAADESNGLDAPLASPLRAPPALFPRTLVQVGANDSLLDDSLAFSDTLVGAGVSCATHVVSGQGHIWPILSPGHPDSRASDHVFARFVAQIADDYDHAGGSGRRRTT